MKLKFHFSDFLFMERKKRKWTQSEMVIRSGLTRATFSAIESQSVAVTLESMEKILGAFEMSLMDFAKYVESATSR